MRKFYAGVGSRETPQEVCCLMTRLAKKLAGQGWTLRSGHAAGADRAFEVGAGGDAIVYLPWPTFGIVPYEDDPGMPVKGEAVCLPDLWQERCRELVKLGVRYSLAQPKLHGRNWAQVLGHTDACRPSAFVLCWCPVVGGKPQGGTATAVNLASLKGIEVRNLWHAEVRAAAEAWLRK